EDLRTSCLAVGLIDQTQYRGGVSVIDKFVRHECVQQRLYRWIGRLRVDQTGALHAHHFLIGHSVAREQLAQGFKPHCWHSGRLMLAMSHPEPLTQRTSASSPSRSFVRVFTEVL